MHLRETLSVIGLLLLVLLVGLAFLFVAAQTLPAALQTPVPQTAAPSPGRPATAFPAATAPRIADTSPTTTAEPPGLDTCSPAQVWAALNALPPYTPTQGEFVEIADGGFTAGGVQFAVRGVNYYPVQSPWRRFLNETTHETTLTEFNLLREAGLNTLRIFLWYEPLFQCPGNGAVPRPEAFSRLDEFIRLAAGAGFRLIVTLNDLPDLEDYPLYTAPEHTQAQTRYITRRYRDEPAIMAWDLRNEGDIDYRERFDRAQVLDWLAQTSAMVREIDANHLITAGWLQDSAATAPHVDFVSFHHWRSAAELADRIGSLRRLTDKPLLLEELGYSTLGRSEMEQAVLLDQAITTAEGRGLAGWLIWTAFDFPREATCLPPNCPSPNNQEHYFGLWRVDYTPKPVVEVVMRFTRGP